MATVDLVIPCYNEEARFPTAQFSAFADAHPDIHYILVNDGSRDNTVAVLRSAIEDGETQPESYIFLGQILFESREFTEAATVYQQLLRVDPAASTNAPSIAPR